MMSAQCMDSHYCKKKKNSLDTKKRYPLYNSEDPKLITVGRVNQCQGSKECEKKYIQRID